jgi:isopentenyl diphosphate isomerase/L-lactate dehydrogenase-like FMN-dependent dehydrogenase
MGSLFDTEDIMRIYWKDKERTFKEEYAKEYEKKYAKEYDKKAGKKIAKETARRMIEKGKMSIEDIADCVPDLSMDELKELEAEVMQLV